MSIHEIKENISPIKTYKDILDGINKIENEHINDKKIIICVLLVTSFASLLVIIFCPSFIQSLLENFKALEIFASYAPAASSIIFTIASILYFLIKEDEIDKQRNTLIKQISSGFDKIPNWNTPVKKEEIQQLSIDLLNKKLQEQNESPEIKAE